MNKHFLSGLFLIIISLASCSKREIELDEADPTMVKAITENLIEANATSKSEKVVLWNPGDEIAVFSGELSGKFESTLKKKPSSAAVFRGDLGLEAWPEEMDIWAVYPYSEEAFFDGETITTVLPSEQIARDGEFGKDMNLAIAHSNTSTLQFYNVGGGIRFSVTEEGIKKVIFEGLSGEIISGKVKIGFSEDGLPEIRRVISGSQFITILPPDGQETFQKDTWYYIVVIPGSLEHGYKLRFYKDSDYARKVSNNSMKIKRNFYRDMERADEGIEYEATTTHFPETMEEWEESISLTEEIGGMIVPLIDSLAVASSEEFLYYKEQIERIEGVEDVIFNTEEKSVSIMQKDSLWVNFFSFPSELSSEAIPMPTPSYEPDRDQHRNHSGQSFQVASQNTTNNNPNEDYYVNSKRKALLLVPPFRYSFGEDFSISIDYLVELLGIAGFQESDISIKTERSNFESVHSTDIFQFRGNYLSDYDFIFIRTHGGTAYRAKKRKGEKIEHTTILFSSTPYNKKTVNHLVEEGKLQWSDIAIAALDENHDGYGEYYLCMTPSFLGNAQFDNSCVIITACTSARILVNGNGGSMIQTFLDKKAGIVSGYTFTTWKSFDIPLSQEFVSLLSHGLSFQDAIKYIQNSVIVSNYSQQKKTYLINHYRQYGYSQDDLGWVPFTTDSRNFHYEPLNLSRAYHLVDPYPILDTVIQNDGKCSLSWKSVLTPFQFQWPIYSSDLAGWTNSHEEVSLTIHYEVYVDGKELKDSDYPDDTINQAYCTLSPNNHSWYVVAKIMDNDTVIASYQSREGHFTVTGDVIKVTSVSIDKSNLELNVGNTLTLKATILPSNATNKNVTWSSSNTSVASVSSAGEVKGIAKGNATITVKTEDGGKTATCRVTVVETKIPVSGVSLNKSSLSMAVGDTQTLTTIVTPSNATDKSVTWSSSNTSVATVSSSGVVTAKKSGTAVITVKTNDGGKKATCNVTVKETSVGGDIEGTERDSWN